jgi:hypothetical protein
MSYHFLNRKGDIAPLRGTKVCDVGEVNTEPQTRDRKRIRV